MRTSTKIKRPLALTTAALTLVVMATGLAFACVPQPLITLTPLASGPGGTQVSLQGVAFGAVPVEIRWNTLDGPQLATTQGPQISTTVTIPPSPDGLYSILAFERRTDGSVGSSARAAFEVTSIGSTLPPVSTPATSGGVDRRPPKPSSGVSIGAASFGGALLLAAGLLAGSLWRGRRHKVLSSYT